MSINLLLIVVSFISLTYLIYRYARYSNWRSTVIGQSFMMMKGSLWALLAFILGRRLLPDWAIFESVALLLLGFMTAAIVVQTVVVVRLQGGVKRRRRTHSGHESEADAESL